MSYPHPTPAKTSPPSPLHLQVYYSFLSNIVHQGLDPFVVPIPQPTLVGADVLQQHGVKLVDFIHVDASHDYESCVGYREVWFRVRCPAGVGRIYLGGDVGLWV